MLGHIVRKRMSQQINVRYSQGLMKEVAYWVTEAWKDTSNENFHKVFHSTTCTFNVHVPKLSAITDQLT